MLMFFMIRFESSQVAANEIINKTEWELTKDTFISESNREKIDKLQGLLFFFCV